MTDHNERVMEPFHTEPEDHRPVDGKGYRGTAAVPNPGVLEHQPRPTDVYPEQERRAERQVAGMFMLATLLALAFCVAYYAIPEDEVVFGWRAHNLALGTTLGLSLLLIGIGAIQWAKKLMDDHEVVELRHPTSSSREDRETALAALSAGAAESGIGRRPLIRNSLMGAMAVLGLPAIVTLTDLGPVDQTSRLTTTVWRKGMRVVNDVSGTPIRPDQVEVGQLVNGEPVVLVPTGDEAADEENGVLHGHDLLKEKAKAAVILVRMRPDEINAREGQENWDVDGILCFSKICTHVGCPISLYEQQTHHVLCPCHQSTFDLSDGARVTFGPAARPLPQLQLGVDEEGYLIAMDGFNEVVGPSYPTMPREDL
jgi:ubiquinol-cytochrome c reductase iron-sulfur subunit